MDQDNRALVTAQPSTRSRSGSTSDEWLNEAKRQFAAIITPCYVLTVGASVDRDAKKAWMAAAFRALQYLPADLLRQGVETAMRQADHPAKIVPAIERAVGDRFRARKDREANELRLAAQLREQLAANTQLALPPTADGGETTTEILDRLWPTRHTHEAEHRVRALNLDPNRSCRAPSPEDYERLFGVRIAEA